MSTDSQQAPTPKPKMRRSMRILLTVSLTLNFLVAGVVIGGAVAHWRDDGPGHRDFGFTSPYTRALEHEDRRAIGKAIRGQYRASGGNRAKAAALYREVVGLLRAPELDVSALQDALDRQNRVSGSRQEMAQKVWIDRLQAMTPEERGAYADRLEEMLKHRRGRGPKSH